jgi:acyl dehydratase
VLVVDRPGDLKAHLGVRLPSDWLLIDQQRIDRFADATGDHFWIHCDVERAAREVPGGKTIAHGFLSLSLIAGLSTTAWQVERKGLALNYGLNRVRFIAPVPSGTAVRAIFTFRSVEDIAGGVRLTLRVDLEMKGFSKPAMVAEMLMNIYD